MGSNEEQALTGYQYISIFNEAGTFFPDMPCRICTIQAKKYIKNPKENNKKKRKEKNKQRDFQVPKYTY